MTDAAKELDAMADAFEQERRGLTAIAVQEASQRRFVDPRDVVAHRASGVYEADLRSKAAVYGDCARRLRERVRSLRGEEAA